MEILIPHILTFIGGGVTLTVLEKIFSRKKQKAEVASLDVDTEIKLAQAWRRNFEDLQKEYEKAINQINIINEELLAVKKNLIGLKLRNEQLETELMRFNKGL